MKCSEINRNRMNPNQSQYDRRVIDKDWFASRWVDRYNFERDWFHKKWIHREKFGRSDRT